MAIIFRALARVKQDLGQFLPEPAIRQAACEAGHHWRNRLLDPVATVQLFVLQILHFNTSLTALRHLAGPQYKPSAYCQARLRLPLLVMQNLLRKLCDVPGATGRYYGHKLWLADGSSASLPDNKALQRVFPQPRRQAKGCGFPLIKLLGIFDAATGLFFEMITGSLHTHEQSKIWQFHPLLAPGDVLLGDRGLCSFWHAAMLCSRGIFCVLRMHQRQIVDFHPHRKHKHGKGKNNKGKNNKGRPTKGLPTSKWVRRLGKHDQIVEWVRPQTRPKWMSVEQFAAMPLTLQVREVRHQLPRQGQRTITITIATTLLDPKQYPKHEILWLYQVRWEVETHFRQLKTTMQMRVLKCKTVDGVKKELLAFALAYNLVRLTMNEAAKRQNVDIERISFLDTLRWLTSAAPGDELPDLIINPWRPARQEPRVLKRRPKQFDLMNKPRSELRKRLHGQRVTPQA
jgi:DDE family transposase